jgi:hypothetical protein
MSRASTLRHSAAGAYAAIGVVALLAPARVPGIFGGTAGTPDARTEVRAVYAGIPLAFAGSLAAASGPGAGEDAVLRTVGAASAGMAVARLAGCVVERHLPAWPTSAFLALEAGLAVALRAARRAETVDRRR